jgi:hypothetical protein
MLASEMIKTMVDLIAKHGDQRIWIDDNSSMFKEIDDQVDNPIRYREYSDNFNVFVIKAEVIK